MKIRRIVALLLLIVTVGSLFAACKKPELKETIPRNAYGPPDAAPGTELSEEWKDKIVKVHAKTNNRPVSWYDEATKTGNFRHYGTFNGYCVVLEISDIESAFTQRIAGYEFKKDTFFNLLVFIFGETIDERTSLKHAYTEGLFTEEQIGEIYNYHKSIYPEYYS